MSHELSPVELLRLFQGFIFVPGWEKKTLAEDYTTLDRSNDVNIHFLPNSLQQFQFASNIYRIIRDGHTQEPDEICFFEYCLYRLFDPPKSSLNDLSFNPFLYHFLLYFHTTHTVLIKNVLFMILNGNGVGGLSINELHRTDPHNIPLPLPHLRNSLSKQGFDEAEIDNVVLKDSDTASDQKIDYRTQLIYLHKSIMQEKNSDDRLLSKVNMLYGSIGLFEYDILKELSEPFNWVTKKIYTNILMTSINDEGKASSRRDLLDTVLIRVPANHDWVDFIHTCIITNLIDSRTELPLLIHEFVSYNIRQNPDEWVIRLLCTFLLSLSNKHYINPEKDYQALFSGFLPWIGTVHEAWKVYVSANNPD